ncbi:MAG: N-acyl-D-glucosamine 2-epimerase, partial [Chloroflexi bacterium]|nr:N-acyl-D-glucosamine 2-epimerase [Chloroflexota bacterium]
GYHSMELCYLSAVYINLLITKEPMDFYFKPMPNGFKDNILHVSPDILPPGSIRIEAVEIDGQPHTDFDAEKLTVKLPQTNERVKVKVRISPAQA